MNYGRVFPDCFHDDGTGIPEGRGLEATLTLSLESGDMPPGSEAVFLMGIESENVILKGVASLLSFNPSSLRFLSVEGTGCLEDRYESFFFGSEVGPGLVRVDGAGLGDAAVDGALARLTFEVLSSEDLEISFEEAEVRDRANRPVECAALDWQYDTSMGGGSTDLSLLQNVPNPFNPVTEIVFGIPERSPVTLRVYTVSGRLVRTLVDGVLDAGRHRAVWYGVDSAGEETPSGVYFYELMYEGRRLTRKMALTR
jgi:hypothetical protein